MFGRELRFHPDRSPAERLYIALLGAPMQGIRVRARWVLPRLKRVRSPKRILDAACGTGCFTYRLARRFPTAEVVGMDLEPASVAAARTIAERAGLPNCRFEVGDLAALETEEGYDLILTVDTLEHVEEDQEALRRLFRAVRPGGTLVVHVPAFERRWPLFGWRTNFDVPGHVRPGYRTEELRGRIEEAGFEIETLRPTYGWLENAMNNLSYAITGAEQRNRALYAALFPFLLLGTWLGRWSRPRRGAGVLAVARRPGENES